MLSNSFTCCRTLLTDSQGDSVHAVIESDLQSKDLKAVVGGHKVNGIAVCIGVSVLCHETSSI